MSAPNTASGTGLGAPYVWFLANGASWYGAWGMQHVLFSWLLVGELQADPAWVGTAQMLTTLPALFLNPVGGLLADRFGRRRILVAIQVLGALAAGTLAAIVGAGALSLGVVLVMAPVWGVLQSSQFPAREAILFEVGRAQLSRASAGTTLAQFLFQGAGNALAGLASWLGAVPVLVGQALLAASGLLTIRKLPVSEAGVDRARAGEYDGGILDGLREVARSPLLRVLALLTLSNGLFFLGAYFVAGPVMVRDVYGGEAAEIGLFFMMFPLGSACSSAVLFAAGEVKNPLAFQLGGLFAGALCLMGIGSAPAFGVLLLFVFAWGCAGGVFITMGRTLFLTYAPPTHRARVLAVQGMALMGGAPLSNLGIGWMAEAIGAPATAFYAGLAMFLVVVTAAAILRRRGVL